MTVSLLLLLFFLFFWGWGGGGGSVLIAFLLLFVCLFVFNIHRSGVLTALFDCYMAGAT